MQLNLATFHAPARASATTCSVFSNIPDGLERLKIETSVKSNVGSLTKDEASFLRVIVRNEMLGIALTKVAGDVVEHRDWDTSSSLSCSGLDPIDTYREIGVEIMSKQYGRRRMWDAKGLQIRNSSEIASTTAYQNLAKLHNTILNLEQCICVQQGTLRSFLRVISPVQPPIYS